MIAESRLVTPTSIFALVLVCASVGALTAVMPLAGALLPIAVLLLIGLSRIGRPWLALFVGFLVLQEPMLLLIGSDETSLGFVIKRLDEALLLVLAVWVVIASSEARRALVTKGLGLMIAGCFLGMIVSTAIRGAELAPAGMDLLLFSKPFLLFLIGASIVAKPDEVRRGLHIAIPCMLFVVLFAVVFMAFPALQERYLGLLRSPDERLGMRSAQGFFDGPGPYSWFCAATFALTYSAYLAWGRRYYLYGAITSVAFAILSWRRKSIAGIAAMILLATVVRVGQSSASRRRAILVFTLVSIVAVTVLAPVIASLWQYTLREYGGNPNTIARFALHQASIEIAFDHFPFGTGLASFGSHTSAVHYSSVYQEYGLSGIWGLTPENPAFITDTFWPMVLGQGGVVSLVPYALFVFVLVSTFWRTARSGPAAREDRFLVVYALFVMVGSLLESTSSHIYDSTMQSALAMIPAGIAWTRINSMPSGTAPDSSFSQSDADSIA